MTNLTQLFEIYPDAAGATMPLGLRVNDLVYAGGLYGTDPVSGVPQGDLEAQTRLALTHLAAAVTGGELEVCGARAADLEPITTILRRMQVDCDVDADRLRVCPSSPVAIRQITTAPWPGFPSDMVSLISVLAMQATGRTLVHDWMYELRLFALEQLSGMGANLFLCDPHRMIIDGPARLTGRTLDSRDLRSGMALIAAALAATGTSRIQPLETVERGYAHLVERLRALGAQIDVEQG